MTTSRRQSYGHRRSAFTSRRGKAKHRRGNFVAEVREEIVNSAEQVHEILNLVKSKRKPMKPKEDNVTLGPTVKEGELVFSLAHIFASFNDTFTHITDLFRKETLVWITSSMMVKVDRDESSPYVVMPAVQDVAQRCKELGVTALHIKLYATSGNKMKKCTKSHVYYISCGHFVLY